MSSAVQVYSSSCSWCAAPLLLPGDSAIGCYTKLLMHVISGCVDSVLHDKCPNFKNNKSQTNGKPRLVLFDLSNA